MENNNWKKHAVSYSENVILGNSLRTYYNNKKEIVYCESSLNKRDELLKGLKRLYSKDLTNDNKRKNHNKRFKGKRSPKKQDETKKKT